MAFEVSVSAGRAISPGDGKPVSVTVGMSNPRAQNTSFMSAFTGGHLLHLAVAACVLNDLYREAELLGIALDAVSVTATGAFGGHPAVSTGITYSVSVTSPADEADVQRLIEHVDEIAEIPNTLKRSTTVARVPLPGRP